MPRLTALERDLAQYLGYYNFDLPTPVARGEQASLQLGVRARQSDAP